MIDDQESDSPKDDMSLSANLEQGITCLQGLTLVGLEI